MGQAAVSSRLCLFLMDYPGHERLKLPGHTEVLDARDHPELVEQVAAPEMVRLTERIFRIRIVSYD